MTNRIATLRRAALDLRTNIFRSLSWGQRVAHVFTVLASGTTDAFGVALSDALRKRGYSSEEFGHKWGKAFGSKLFRTLLGKYRDDELVEIAMLNLVTRISLKPQEIDEGMARSSIESYLLKGAHQLVLTELRKKNIQNKREVMFEERSEDDAATGFDFEDPSALRTFDQLMDASDVRAIKMKLRAILPWAPGYLDMLLDGYSDKEIIGDHDKGRPSLLAEKLQQEFLTNPKGQPMTMGMWSKPGGWKDKILGVIRQHMQDEA
jgi:hypothetical protein